jgi:hypothetical protein
MTVGNNKMFVSFGGTKVGTRCIHSWFFLVLYLKLINERDDGLREKKVRVIN